jgi:hypothetical protein
MNLRSWFISVQDVAVRGVERVKDANRGWKVTVLGVGLVLAGSVL